MNYYERIQEAIDFMEDNLENEIKVETIAKQIFMSESGFYRMFFAITGYQVKDYFIRRRINCAFEDLKYSHRKVIDVAFQYSYNSVDAFSRIFKKITGYTPSTCAKGIYQYKFERINVMEKYFETEDNRMSNCYPDIKVISSLPEMTVAYYCFYGKNPEEGAFSAMKEWVLEQGIDYKNKNYRIFGYNAPDTDVSAEEYGYEVCITIPEHMKVEDDKIKVKRIAGGRYAVVSIKPKKNLGEEIILGWKRFSKWLEGSKYVYGDAQWLEEHLDFGEDFEHFGGVDLYMPIKEQENCEEIHITEEYIEPFTAATYTASGCGAEADARKYLLDWIGEQGIDLSSEKTQVFSNYNFERINKMDFSYKIFIRIPDDMNIEDAKIKKEIVTGGMYLKKCVKYKNNAQSWYNFIRYIESNDNYSFGTQPFMEEYIIKKPEINRETQVVQHMPVIKIHS